MINNMTVRQTGRETHTSLQSEREGGAQEDKSQQSVAVIYENPVSPGCKSSAQTVMFTLSKELRLRLTWWTASL